LNEKFTESESVALRRRADRTFTIRVLSVLAILAFNPGNLRQTVVIVFSDADNF